MQEIKTFFIKRNYKPEATIGHLIDPDFVNEDGDLEAKIICATLERPNLNNQRDNPSTPENESSCIPEGTYLCKKYSSEKFPDTWQITGVKNRSDILFHCANFVSQLEGCVAVCMQIIDNNPKNNPNAKPEQRWYASQSRDAFEKFKKVMPEEFQIKIVADA